MNTLTNTTNQALFHPLPAAKRPTKRCSEKDVSLLHVTCDLGLGLFPPRNFTVKLAWSLVFPCLLLVYTVVLDWNRILGFFSFWAGSWSRQTQSRLTSSPRRFPRQFAVCVNTLFLPSSSRPPARWRPAVGLLCVGTHGETETPTARELTSSIRSLPWCL